MKGILDNMIILVWLQILNLINLLILINKCDLVAFHFEKKYYLIEVLLVFCFYITKY